jgi:hypothetical protein
MTSQLDSLRHMTVLKSSRTFEHIGYMNFNDLKFSIGDDVFLLDNGSKESKNSNITLITLNVSKSNYKMIIDPYIRTIYLIKTFSIRKNTTDDKLLQVIAMYGGVFVLSER